MSDATGYALKNGILFLLIVIIVHVIIKNAVNERSAVARMEHAARMKKLHGHHHPTTTTISSDKNERGSRPHARVDHTAKDDDEIDEEDAEDDDEREQYEEETSEDVRSRRRLDTSVPSDASAADMDEDLFRYINDVDTAPSPQPRPSIYGIAPTGGFVGIQQPRLAPPASSTAAAPAAPSAPLPASGSGASISNAAPYQPTIQPYSNNPTTVSPYSGADPMMNGGSQGGLKGLDAFEMQNFSPL